MLDCEAIYRKCPDPWRVRTDWYERRKRGLLIGSLTQPRYGRALELACGNGAMTCVLAQRCDDLIAADAAPTAVLLTEQAVREEGLANVRVALAQVPAQWPAQWPAQEDAGLDLIVVSELAYYLAPHDLAQLLAQCAASLNQGGEWVMCHFVKDFPERTRSTRDIHGDVDRIPGLAKVVSHRDELFQLDVWRKQTS